MERLSMTDARMVVGAALLVLTGAAHTLLGERYIIGRMMRRDQPKLFGSDDFTKRTLRFVWHITTVLFLGWAAVLLVWREGVPSSDAAEAWILVVVLALAAAITLVISRARHVSWVVELVVAGLLASAII